MYAPVPVAFKEEKDGLIKVKQKNYNDRITNESKINKKFDNWFLTMSDFQKVILNAQHKKLVEKSINETDKRIKEKINENLLNLSIRDIYRHINQVLVDILNEVSRLLKKKHITIEDFIKDFIFILTKNDRLFYVGIVFCFIGMCIFILQSSST